jgi:hypothetical protein
MRKRNFFFPDPAWFHIGLGSEDSAGWVLSGTSTTRKGDPDAADSSDEEEAAASEKPKGKPAAESERSVNVCATQPALCQQPTFSERSVNIQ